MSLSAATALLLEAFRAALAEVSAESVVPPALPEPPPGRTVVVGAGKASAAMARAVESHWNTDLSGMVVVPYGYSLACERISVLEAAHPVPDLSGQAAAAKMLDLVRDLGPDDLVIALFSGGGSALLPLPLGGITIEDKRSLTSQLLNAGANIGEINAVRKHLSAIKGGRLAEVAAPARVANILISDVAGDDPATIASGPAVPDPSSLDDAKCVVTRYHLQVSRAVLRHLDDPRNETPKPGDPCFARVSTHIAASAQDLLGAAVRFFDSRGIAVLDLGDSLEGESRQLALDHAVLARKVAATGSPVAPPCVLLSGGETTVTIHGTGCGGSNMEYLLAFADAIEDSVPYAALACDTDGSDGSTGAAGAVATSDSWARAQEIGLDMRQMLEDNDSRSFFSALDDLVATGPTFNNLNDFRAILLPGEGPMSEGPKRGRLAEAHTEIVGKVRSDS